MSEIYAEQSSKTQEQLQDLFASLNNIEKNEQELKHLKNALGVLYQNMN